MTCNQRYVIIGDIFEKESKYCMKFKSEDWSDCPLCIPVQILSGKWKINILGLMMMNDEPWRFMDLKKRLGVTSKVLSAILKELEEDGIIRRSVIDDTPVRVEYSLTEAGNMMRPFLTEMFKWGSEYIANRTDTRNS